MSWRRLRRRLPALTLVLLGLLLAAPLSTGDRGLWLSVAPTSALLLEAPSGGLPAEHSTVLPDRQARATTAVRSLADGGHRTLDEVPPLARLPLNESTSLLQDRLAVPLQPPIAALAAPRAPPA